MANPVACRLRRYNSLLRQDRVIGNVAYFRNFCVCLLGVGLLVTVVLTLWVGQQVAGVNGTAVPPLQDILKAKSEGASENARCRSQASTAWPWYSTLLKHERFASGNTVGSNISKRPASRIAVCSRRSRCVCKFVPSTGGSIHVNHREHI
jgi:hypothetical protein